MSYNYPYQGQPPLEYYENILLAVRIIDGLFIGNAISSQDDEFLFSNKVTHIVNCAALDVPNVFSDHGILYLSFPWRDGSVILDPQNRKISRIAKFMDRAFEKGECVLLHSLHGISRCCVIACAFLMYRFDWSLEDSYNFVKINHPDMDIAPQFMIQLKNYAKSKGPSHEAKPPLSECLLLKNTFVNSLPVDSSRFLHPPPKSSNNRRVQFTSKLVAKKRTPSHNPSILKPILKVKLPPEALEEAREILRQTSDVVQPPPVKKIAFQLPSENEVSSRTLKSQNASAASENNVTESQNSRQSVKTAEQPTMNHAVPPPEPRSPNHHRIKRPDRDTSTLSDDKRATNYPSSIGIHDSQNVQDTSILISKGNDSSNQSEPDKVVLRNNFTSSHTKVTQLPNPPKSTFSLEQQPSNSVQSNTIPSSSNNTTTLRRSHTFEIVTQASVDPDKRKRRKRSSSVEKRSLQSSYSGLVPSESDEDDHLSKSLSSSGSQSTHRKRPTLPQKSSVSQLSIGNSSTHRVFQTREPASSSLSVQPNFNGTSMQSDLSGLLTSAQLASKKILRRPRSATHRKRKPTPMHQRPQSAPNQKDRANGTMSRISSLENIYGPNINGNGSSSSGQIKKKKVKSRSTSPSQGASTSTLGSTLKKKKKVKKIPTANYSNIESRLYNPTQSFLRKTNH